MDQMEKKNAEERAAHEQQLEAARQQAAQAVAAGVSTKRVERTKEN